MRIQHYLTSAAAISLVAGFAASSASADVTVTATITKTKNVAVDEVLYKDKFVDIDAVLDLEIDRGAESLALANQRLDDNKVTSEKDPNATITDSVVDNNGLTQVNNAAGHLNQQGNLIAAAVDGQQSKKEGFAEAQASAMQTLNANTLTDEAGNTADTTNSITGNTGVTHGNNVAGQMNQQLNALSLAVSFAASDKEALALSEADLGQWLTGNEVTSEAAQTATISGSITGNTGIVGYNQAAGGFNQQGNVVAVSATSPAAALQVQ
jgi:hypothetical protein